MAVKVKVHSNPITQVVTSPDSPYIFNGGQGCAFTIICTPDGETTSHHARFTAMEVDDEYSGDLYLWNWHVQFTMYEKIS